MSLLRNSNSSFLLTFLRMTDEVEDGGTAPKISSLSGVNRKRKWKEEVEEEAEEQQGEESSDADTSSDDDDGEEKAAQSEHQASASQETDVKQEPKGVEAVAHSSEPKEVEKSAQQPKEGPVRKPSQPAVFVPVDRMPEIQVQCHCMIHISSEVPP